LLRAFPFPQRLAVVSALWGEHSSGRVLAENAALSFARRTPPWRLHFFARDRHPAEAYAQLIIRTTRVVRAADLLLQFGHREGRIKAIEACVRRK